MNLRVISFNIHKGFGYFNRRYNLQTIRELLKKHDPDIVLLQELHGLHPKNLNFTQSPLETIADQHWPHWQHGVNSIYTKNFHGNAIISKYPIQNWENHELTTNPLEKRGLLHAKVSLPNSESIHLYSTHLNLLPLGQIKQVQKIGTIINSINSKEPCLIGGDFNDWTNLCERHFTQELNFKSIKKLATFPSIAPLLSLDKMFFKGLKLRGIQKINDYKFCSDHLPILADFEL